MSRKRLAYPFAVLIVLVAASVGLWCSRPDLPRVKAEELSKTEPPAEAAKGEVYDADKDHLWNRMHAALFVRLTTMRGPNEELVPEAHSEYHADELDTM